MAKHHMNLWYVSIVAIVAVVAIVILIGGNGSLSLSEENLAGEAFKGFMVMKTNPNLQPSCTDSDGGLKKYVKGTCTDSNGSITDECFNNGNNVWERFCHGGRCRTWNQSCPNGCSNRACIQ